MNEQVILCVDEDNYIYEFAESANEALELLDKLY
jgi:hypothetical protein